MKGQIYQVFTSVVLQIPNGDNGRSVGPRTFRFQPCGIASRKKKRAEVTLADNLQEPKTSFPFFACRTKISACQMLYVQYLHSGAP